MLSNGTLVHDFTIKGHKHMIGGGYGGAGGVTCDGGTGNGK